MILAPESGAVMQAVGLTPVPSPAGRERGDTACPRNDRSPSPAQRRGRGVRVAAIRIPNMRTR